MTIKSDQKIVQAFIIILSNILQTYSENHDYNYENSSFLIR
jgi:hypothetical protein